eukprot:3067722-Pyramimonas_sp.AAC.1
MLEGSISDQVYPAQGIAAGASPATYEAKHYMYPLITSTLSPNAASSMHIVDFTLSAWAGSKVYCLESFVAFVLQIKDGIEKLAFTLACPQIALVASSTDLLNKGKKLLGDLGGAASWGAANL